MQDQDAPSSPDRARPSELAWSWVVPLALVAGCQAPHATSAEHAPAAASARRAFASTFDRRGGEIEAAQLRRAELQVPIAARATVSGAPAGPAAPAARARWRLAPLDGADAAARSAGVAEIELAPVVSERSFRDVLVSWNVDASPDVAYRVDVRVAAVDLAWSPWLALGAFGDVSELPAAADRAPGVRVDTDYVRAEAPLARAQVRVRAVVAPRAADGARDSRDPGASADRARERTDPRAFLDRVTVCVSDPDADLGPEPTVARAAPSALDVPFRSQRTEDPAIAGRICSPTSVAMVLAWRGVARPTAEVASLAYDAAHDLYGNWPRNVQAAYACGVSGYLTRVTSLAEAERFLAAGQPLVASIRARAGELHGAPYASTNGHLIVITGFTPEGDVRVNDPAAPDAAAGRRVYARADVERVWLERGQGTCYVLESPAPGRVGAR